MFAIANLFYGIFNTTPLMGFLVMFSEVCQCLNRWMASMSQKIACKENYNMDIMKECSTFWNDGLNRAVLTFSGIEL